MSELEELRDRVEQLQAALGMNITLPDATGLTPLKAKMVGILLKRDIVSREMFLDLMYGNRPDEPGAQTIDVHLCQIKKRLSNHGIDIKNRYGAGWYISAPDKAKLKSLMETA